MHLLDFFDKFSLRPENAKELKGLILDLAIRGRLTEEWRKENPVNLSPAGGGEGGGIEPASVLLDKIKTEKARLIKEKKIRKEKPLPAITKEEIPFALPEGWEWCRLGEIGLINPRNTISDESEVGFVPMKSISEQYGIIPNPEKRLWKDVKKSFTHFRENDVAFAKITPCFENSKAALFRNLPNEYGAGTTELHVFRNVIGFNISEFIYLKFKTPNFISSGKDLMTGSAGQKRVPKSYVQERPLALPPLPEQQAIVAIVNQLMAEVEELKAQTTERAQLRRNYVKSALRQLTTADSSSVWHQLKPQFPSFFDTAVSIDKLKEAILQLAVQGKLTKQWREENPDVEPASVLLEKIKEEKARLIKEKKIKNEKALPEISEEEIPFGLPEGWVWSDLQTLCERVTDGFHHTPKKLNIGYKYISATHIKEDGIKWNDSLHIGEKDHKNLYKKAQPRRGDILIVNRGAGCGTTAIVDMDEEFSFQNAALIGFNLKSIDANYMNIILRNKKNEMFNDFAQGGAQPMISNKKLKTLTIPLAPGEEQKAIVQIVNQLMDHCDQIKSAIENRNTLSTDFLRSSIREVMEQTQSLA